MRSFIDHSEFESNNTSQLRPHQQEAFDDIIDALNNGQRSGFVEMATGSGKTAIMSKLAELYLTDNSGRVIFLAPSLQICQQINEEIRKKTKLLSEKLDNIIEIKKSESDVIASELKHLDNQRKLAIYNR